MLIDNACPTLNLPERVPEILVEGENHNFSIIVNDCIFNNDFLIFNYCIFKRKIT